ncbi:MAG: hypothetical protein NWP83_01125, partial [Spirosomaceae bacterium]|nr:hypothetical protein [Spirosomataceae bacterium]
LLDEVLLACFYNVFVRNGDSSERSGIGINYENPIEIGETAIDQKHGFNSFAAVNYVFRYGLLRFL